MEAKATQTHSGAGPSDAALVLAARAGEGWAQEALFRRHAKMVNGLAYRLLGRDQDVDDLVQDCFVQALRGLHSLDNPQAFSSWLGSIVVRTAHKTIRRRSMMARFGMRPMDPVEVEALRSRASNPEAGAELAGIYRVLDQLKPHARIALILHRVEGMSIPEVADHMGLSQSTVKRRLADAARKLAPLAESPEGT